jgi:hypothetical protein
MADNDDTPAAPKPPARRAPRKAATPKPPASSAVEPPPASKPRRKPAAAGAPSTEPVVPKKASAPPKPRSTKRATPPTQRAPKPKENPMPVKDEAKRGWKNKAAIAGGLAAVGAAATAALLSLRGSTPKKDAAEPTPAETLAALESSEAHMPDGTDASKSFQAGIADEGIVPE